MHRTQLADDWHLRRPKESYNDVCSLQRHVAGLEKELRRFRADEVQRQQTLKEISDLSKRLFVFENSLMGMMKQFHGTRLAFMGMTKAEYPVYDLLISKPTLHGKAMAVRLNLSLTTVRFHIRNILRKAGVRSRHEL